MLKLSGTGGREIIVDGENAVFEGTDYHGHTFSFRCQPVSATKLAEIQKRHLSAIGKSGIVHTDAIGVVRDTFLQCVVGWDGICDESGSPRPCDAANKAFVFDYYTDLAGLVVQATTEASRQIDKAKEDALGKS